MTDSENTSEKTNNNAKTCSNCKNSKQNINGNMYCLASLRWLNNIDMTTDQNCKHWISDKF